LALAIKRRGCRDLIRHGIDELQAASLALNVGDHDRHSVRHIRGILHICGARGWVGWNMVQQDTVVDVLAVARERDPSRRPRVPDALLIYHRQGTWEDFHGVTEEAGCLGATAPRLDACASQAVPRRRWQRAQESLLMERAQTSSSARYTRVCAARCRALPSLVALGGYEARHREPCPSHIVCVLESGQV
jgi:hypothetical protein